MTFAGVMIRAPLAVAAAIEHLLYHSLEGVYDSSLGHILCGSLDLVSFQILCIIYGNGDFSIRSP